jgi:hypothetical protein
VTALTIEHDSVVAVPPTTTENTYSSPLEPGPELSLMLRLLIVPEAGTVCTTDDSVLLESSMSIPMNSLLFLLAVELGPPPPMIERVAGPAGPVAPVAPVSPAPVAPVTPVGPMAPVDPVAPVTPVVPFGPVSPVAPFVPLAPVAPVGPVAPIGP